MFNEPGKLNNKNAPPGQVITKKFPVLTFGNTPTIDFENWRFSITGEIKTPIEWNLQDFLQLEDITINAEFHCVTQWSNLDNSWTGIPFAKVLNKIILNANVQYAMIHCYGNYSTNISLDVLMNDDVLFATKHNNIPLSPDHGAPVRLIVPKRYGWKSAKWVKGIEFTKKNRPGFWESRGYHMEGDPIKEQRYDTDQ